MSSQMTEEGGERGGGTRERGVDARRAEAVGSGCCSVYVAVENAEGGAGVFGVEEGVGSEGGGWDGWCWGGLRTAAWRECGLRGRLSFLLGRRALGEGGRCAGTLFAVLDLLPRLLGVFLACWVFCCGLSVEVDVCLGWGGVDGGGFSVRVRICGAGGSGRGRRFCGSVSLLRAAWSFFFVSC
ncbi:hypothetical protein Tco_0248439 [Tanacetum coccineum]